MATITLSDDLYARLQAAASANQRTTDDLLADWINSLPTQGNAAAWGVVAPGTQEYKRRWDAFMQLVGSIQHGEPLTNEEIDELIGEEADG